MHMGLTTLQAAAASAEGVLFWTELYTALAISVCI
jgi:hypothetical protein